MSTQDLAKFCVSEPFEPGSRQAVEDALEAVAALQITSLRTPLRWSASEGAEQGAWRRWLLERLARAGLEVVAAFDAPAPHEHDAFLSAVDTALAARPAFVELRLDPDAPEPNLDAWCRVAHEVSDRAAAAQVRFVLGGLDARKPRQLARCLSHNLKLHAVGVRGDASQLSLAAELPVWATEAGSDAPRAGETAQVEALLAALQSGAERVYWSRLKDAEGDFRGLLRADGSSKLAHRLCVTQGGDTAATLKARWMQLKGRTGPKRTGPHAVIFGGAGFIGSNVASRLLREKRRVLVFDSLARPGVERNLSWLAQKHGDLLQVQLGDVRDAAAVRKAVRGADQVFHFAAQVAVTTSLVDPLDDFEVNARGTFNVLEACRAQETPPSVLFTSTNKVYGGLDDLKLEETGSRWQPCDLETRMRGISEARPLDFHSPYGCSKGSADQYVIDWARTFGVPAVVFRMSCIYGPRQFGTEDQGWVAHFLLRALHGQRITLYGDGKQVRDILFVEDLVDAMLRAQARMGTLAGQAFNIGGGPQRTVSLHELLAQIEELTGRKVQVDFEEWRPGDQRYYVSDTRKFQQAASWEPQVGVREGVARLHQWLRELMGLPVQAEALAP